MAREAPRFFTKRGRLTPFALACGYVEKKTVGGVEVTLWMEHNAYHVRGHEFDGRGRVFWDAFPTLGAARARFDRSGPSVAGVA